MLSLQYHWSRADEVQAEVKQEIERRVKVEQSAATATTELENLELELACLCARRGRRSEVYLVTRVLVKTSNGMTRARHWSQ